MTVGRLQIMEVLLMDTDRLFQLFDVLGPPFAESCLRLAVALLTLFRSSIYLGELISE